MLNCPACHANISIDLHYCPLCATALAAPRGTPPLPVGAPGAPPALGLGAGDLGDRLGERLRDTPLGVLYLTSDGLLALCVPAAAFPSPLLRDRGLRELRLLVQAQRGGPLPGVLQVRAFGLSRDGDLLVAYRPPPRGTRLVDDWVRDEGPLPEALARTIVRQAGEAVLSAHQAGVPHRSLAPWCIHASEEGQVLVSGFGLAEFHSVGWRLIQGAPHFLSPEQAQGQSGDQRSTVYSLGALLHYLVTGAPPLEGRDLADLLLRLPSVIPSPPSHARPGLSPGLDGIVARALAKEPERRHPTLRLLLDELAPARRRLAVTEADLVAVHALPGEPPDEDDDLHERMTLPLALLKKR